MKLAQKNEITIKVQITELCTYIHLDTHIQVYIIIHCQFNMAVRNNGRKQP